MGVVAVSGLIFLVRVEPSPTTALIFLALTHPSATVEAREGPRNHTLFLLLLLLLLLLPLLLLLLLQPPLPPVTNKLLRNNGRSSARKNLLLPESADFVSVMESESKGKDTRRAALDTAAAKHIQVAKAAAQGQGVDRHLYAMRTAAAEANGGEGQMGREFFGDPLAAETSGWRLSTSNVSMPFLSSFG